MKLALSFQGRGPLNMLSDNCPVTFGLCHKMILTSKFS